LISGKIDIEMGYFLLISGVSELVRFPLYLSDEVNTLAVLGKHSDGSEAHRKIGRGRRSEAAQWDRPRTTS